MRHLAALLLFTAIVLAGASAPLYTIDVNAAISTELPPDFASFSVEVPCAKILLTYDYSGLPRTSYLNLIGFLRNASRSFRGPNLRIGGDSSDHTIYRDNCTGVPLPKSITYCASQYDLSAIEHFASINGTITIGLNLGHDVVAEAVGYASAVVDRVQPANLIEAYEIGNEPDLYRSNGLRSSNYSFEGYSSDFQKWFDALRGGTRITFPAIQGAVFCCGDFNAGLDEYMKSYESRGFFKSISYHHYPLATCGGRVVTLEQLLEPQAAQSVTALTKYAQVSRHFNRPFYIGEGNSVACGGSNDVSNTFGAALWAIDALFNAASSNITRWNFHGCTGGPYSPVWLSESSGPSDTRYAKAQPLYYGMWVFTWLIAGDARVLGSVSPSGVDPAIVVWSARSDNWGAIADATCSVRITAIVLDKRFSNNATSTDLAIKFDGLQAGKPAHVRFMAPSAGGVTATGDISFGGLTFEGSTTGLPLGSDNVTTFPLDQDATLSLTSVPGSAVFIEIFDGCQ
jgi:hypothetical protein